MFNKTIDKISTFMETHAEYTAISRLIAGMPVAHQTSITKDGNIIRCFTVKTDNINIVARRICEYSKPIPSAYFQPSGIRSIKYTVVANDISLEKENLAKNIYNKMYKLWERSRTNHAR